MKYARMGDSGLIVSRLCLGTMTFTLGNKSMAAVYKVDEALARELVARSLDAGVNFFDTADAYAGGESETVLGRCLEGRRDEVVISTKVGFRGGDGPLIRGGLSRRHLFWAVDESLRRLGTDWIDLLFVHKEDEHTPMEETLVALDALVQSGKVRYVGYSNWAPWRAAAALEFQRSHGLARFISAQVYYSLVGRDIENDTVPMMRHFGVGMMAWSPLAQGFLTGRVTRENLKSGDHRLASSDFLPIDLERGFAAVDACRRIAERHDASIPQVALAWMLARPAATSVVIGVSKTSQLEDDLGAAALEIGVDEIEELDALVAPPRVYPNWFIEATRDRAHREALGG